MLQEFDLVHDAVKERLTRLERHLPCDQLCRVFTNIHYPMTRLQRAISFQILCNRDTEWAAFLPLQAESKELAKAVDRFRIRLESRIKWLCRWQSAIRLQVKINRHDRVQTALNRVASRKRELIKNRRKAAKEAKKAAGGGSTLSHHRASRVQRRRPRGLSRQPAPARGRSARARRRRAKRRALPLPRRSVRSRRSKQRPWPSSCTTSESQMPSMMRSRCCRL